MASRGRLESPARRARRASPDLKGRWESPAPLVPRELRAHLVDDGDFDEWIDPVSHSIGCVKGSGAIAVI